MNYKTLLLAVGAAVGISFFAYGTLNEHHTQGQDDHHHDESEHSSHDDQNHENGYEHEEHEEHQDDHDHEEEGHSESANISTDIADRSGIRTEVASAKNLVITQTLFGVIDVPTNQKFTVITPYDSIVKQVHVQLGDQVKKNQVLLTVENVNSLQTYTIRSPGKGEITFHDVTVGSKTTDEPLLKITDFSKVWVNLSAFPENIERLKKGQSVSVYDLHQHLSENGNISYISPQMTGGHIARARAEIQNQNGHWRPGMHVKADVVVDNFEADVAIKTSAIQTLENQDVVFIQTDNGFKPTAVRLGRRSESDVEVLEGLTQGSRYVSENSFIIKADLLKSGAAHSH